MIAWRGMCMFTCLAAALSGSQTAAVGTLDWFAQFGPFGVVAGMLWFLLMREQKRAEERAQQTEERIEELIDRTTSVLRDALVVQGRLIEIIESLKSSRLCRYEDK